jgi:hypothetical protein
MYWIYDLSTWILGCLIIGTIVLVSCLGLAFSRTYFYNRFHISADTNEAVNMFVSSMGMLYGLLLGLVAVATWENYTAIENIAANESTAISELYRDVSTLQEPTKTELQQDLKDYLAYVIEIAWPAQKQGKPTTGGRIILTRALGTIANYKTSNVEQQIFLAEVFTAYNRLVECRRLRVQALDTGIPSIFWAVILVGAGLTLITTFLIYTPYLRTHLLITALFSTLLGFMIFLLAAIDNPLRGEISISSDVYSSVLESLKDSDPTNMPRLIKSSH